MKKPILLAILVLLPITLIAVENIAGAQTHTTTSPKPGVKKAGNIAGSIIVSDNQNEAVNQAKKHGLKPDRITERSKNRSDLVVLPEAPDDPKVKALAKEENVKVFPNYVYRSFLIPNDPNYSSQWNLPKISAPEAWDISTGSSDVSIAILDTGVLFEQTIDSTSYNQPDFPDNRKRLNQGETGTTQASDPCWTGAPQDKSSNDCDDDDNGFIDDWQGWDFMGGFRGNDEGCPNHSDPDTYESSGDPTLVLQDNDPQPYSCDSPTSPSILNKDHYNGTCVAWISACFVGHGTMVASVAAAEANNSTLIAGIDHQAEVMNVRVLDGYGWGTTDRIAAGIEYAASRGADVINMSLGSSCDNENFTDPLVEDAIDSAVDADVVMVAASGNESFDTICYPASSPKVMGVGATNQSDVRHGYSNYSKKLDIVAPAGVPVANAPSDRINSNYFSNAGGTSLATPHVAGLASLIRAQEPERPWSNVIWMIRKRADKVQNMAGEIKHRKYGYGRINLHTAMEITEGKLPVYRMYRPSTKTHFYTTNVAERDKAVGSFGFRLEIIAFWARDSSTNTNPVYRLYRPGTKSHFYTIDPSERDNAVNNYNFRDEGIRFYFLDEGAPSTNPVYRLYRSGTKAHFYTTDTSERDNAVNNFGFRDEGVRFRAE